MKMSKPNEVMTRRPTSCIKTRKSRPAFPSQSAAQLSVTGPRTRTLHHGLGRFTETPEKTHILLLIPLVGHRLYTQLIQVHLLEYHLHLSLPNSKYITEEYSNTWHKYLDTTKLNN